MTERPVRAVFLGSGAFAVPILDGLASLPSVRIVMVVTAPDRPAGRGGRLTPVPVAERAAILGLPLFQPPRVRAPESVAAIRAANAGLGILADYGQIIPQQLLDVFPHGVLNIHPSLLPRHRGASPIPAAILAGDGETGVTIIRMDAGLDTGPVVAATRWPLTGTETAPELQARAAKAGATLLRTTIPAWLAGTVAAVPQPAAGATLSRPLSRSDGRLDPERPAETLERQVRAYQPWPGSYVETPAGRLTVWRARAVRGGPQVAPGELVATSSGELVLRTVDGWLALDDVQLPGRRRMSTAELLRGRPRLS